MSSSGDSVSVGAYENLLRIHREECQRSVDLVIELAGLKFDFSQYARHIEYCSSIPPIGEDWLEGDKPPCNCGFEKAEKRVLK